MAAAVVTSIETETRTLRRRPEPVAAVPRPSEPAAADTLDGGLVAAVGELLRSQRSEGAATIASDLLARGVDPTVCAFLEDDLREAAEALADVDAFFQESLESLSARAPSPRVLTERAEDVAVLERVDHLHNVLSNLRRRLVQVAAGLRQSGRRRAPRTR
jgi:hypothetical protein